MALFNLPHNLTTFRARPQRVLADIDSYRPPATAFQPLTNKNLNNHDSRGNPNCTLWSIPSSSDFGKACKRNCGQYEHTYAQDLDKAIKCTQRMLANSRFNGYWRFTRFGQSFMFYLSACFPSSKERTSIVRILLCRLPSCQHDNEQRKKPPSHRRGAGNCKARKKQLYIAAVSQLSTPHM